VCQPEELTTEDEEFIEKVYKAHVDTFPIVDDDEKFKLVLKISIVYGKISRNVKPIRLSPINVG